MSENNKKDENLSMKEVKNNEAYSLLVNHMKDTGLLSDKYEK